MFDIPSDTTGAHSISSNSVCLGQSTDFRYTYPKLGKRLEMNFVPQVDIRI